jgi:hypothetical protein
MKINLLKISLLYALSAIVLIASDTSERFYASFGNWGYLNGVMNGNYVHYSDTNIRLGGNGSQQGPWSPFWGFSIDFTNLSFIEIKSIKFYGYGVTRSGGGTVYFSNTKSLKISDQPRGSATQGMNSSGKSIYFSPGQESVVDLTSELQNLILPSQLNEITIVIPGGGGNYTTIGDAFYGTEGFLEIIYEIQVDSDGDGLIDSEDTFPNDFDNDGLDDVYETNTGSYVSATDAGTNPNIADTDGDGLTDGYEVSYNINPLLEDTDFDGLNDYLEVETLGSNPLLVDSDSDGLDDGIEYNLSNISFDINADSTNEIQSLESSGFLLKSTLGSLSMDIINLGIVDDFVNLIVELKESDSSLDWENANTSNMVMPVEKQSPHQFYRIKKIQFPSALNPN